MKEKIRKFTKNNYHALCDEVALPDNELSAIIQKHSYPPFWVRPNTFATLVLIILEQQISLAAAYAAFTRLKERLVIITPESLLLLSDEELRACYFTRQKAGYARGLAQALITKELNLAALPYKTDDEVRTILKRLKGIGDWSVDVYLMHVLKRTDVFPIGDLALVNAMKDVKNLDILTTKETLLQIAESWRPYRSIATMILWHHYIKKRNIKLIA